MGIFSRLGSLFGDSSDTCSMTINPATGLPMLDGCNVDIAGNPFGVDLHGTTHDSGSTLDSGISTIDTGSIIDTGISGGFDDGCSSFESFPSFDSGCSFDSGSASSFDSGLSPGFDSDTFSSFDSGSCSGIDSSCSFNDW